MLRYTPKGVEESNKPLQVGQLGRMGVSRSFSGAIAAGKQDPQVTGSDTGRAGDRQEPDLGGCVKASHYPRKSFECHLSR